MDKSNKLCLVTGATGFTGRALALELKRRGQNVRAMVRNRDAALDLVDLGIEVVQGDLLDPNSLDKATEGCQRVYNIAAAFRIAGKPDSYYEDINGNSVKSVIESATNNGVEQIVHCSTVGVHGNVSTIPSDENAPYNPGDVYQETKLAGDLIAQKAMKEGAPVSVVRPAGIYGPGDLRFLKLFKTVQNGTFRMFGDGETLYHFTYIDDLVTGIILCGEKPEAIGEVFIVCGNEYVTLNELVMHVAKSTNSKVPKLHLPLWPLLTAAKICESICKPFNIDPPLHMRRCEFFIKNRAFTNQKAKERLGFEPRTSIKDGIEETAKWYASKKLIRN